MCYLGMYFCPKSSLFWVRNLHHSTVYVVICCSRTHIADGRCAYNSFRVQRVQAKEGRSFCHLHFYCVAAQWGRLLVKEFGTSSMVQQCSAPKNYMGPSINQVFSNCHTSQSVGLIIHCQHRKQFVCHEFHGKYLKINTTFEDVQMMLK